MIHDENVFNYFDDIVCINLINRQDRRTYAESIFHNLNIPARFVIVEKHPKGGMYGCFDSHLRVIQSAYDAGKNNILIFEDDLLPTSTYTQDHVKNAITFMQRNFDWHVFYFGYFVFNYDVLPRHSYLNAQQVFPHVVEYRPFATHAYCVNRKGMSNILSHYQKYIGKVHYDIYISRYTDARCFCYAPMLFDQKLCFSSDIEAQNIVECVARKMQCFADRYRFIWWISVLKDFFDTKMNRYFLAALVTIILLTILAVTII